MRARRLDEGSYQDALGFYQKLEARYPFGPYATQAQIESAYATTRKMNPLRRLRQPIDLSNCTSTPQR